MNFKLKTAAAATLAVGLIALSAHASDPAPAAKKHTAAKKEKAPPPPTVAEQIQALRDEMQGQINNLKNDLATKDEQLKQAQQAAADAQASAAKAEAAASAENQAVVDNTTAVDTLKSTVTDLKGNEVSLATTVSDETAKMKKAIDSPGVLHYKGITLTPGGFAAAETVDRTKATGGDIPTAFSSIPYEGADAYSLSEFYGSGRQSRLSLLAEGKTSWGKMQGYYEADFLGTGITSNNNQSNSYVLRQRVIWASAETNSHWKFAGGQMWSMATEDKTGISNASSDIMTPQTIDPNYVTGFVWTRQYGFRVVKSFKKAAFGVAAENPQLLYTATLAGNTPYAVLGSAGQNGGNYNAAISACSPSTSIVNYTNQVQTDSAGNTVNIAVPVYKTVNSCANITNISFNSAPDIIAKAAFDPGWGHYEIFGIGGFAHEIVFPGETTNSNLYGGLKDIVTGLAVAPSLTTAGNFVENKVLGGVGGSLRVPIIPNILTVGAKGLFGRGVGRYGDTTLADLTSNAAGGFEKLENVSGLFTVEATPSPRLSLYLNYGGDYAGRNDSANPASTTLGAPSAAQSAAGVWGGTWKTPSAAAVGYGSHLLNNSACGVTSAPGYNGSSTGYYPGGSCGAQTRDVQEVTGGYWYDFYKGEHGRLRQGVQYGYAVREGWSGAGGLGAKGIDNMFWTTFRYYLP
jgi:phosphoglycolate phosphatase-like HAD superfamily hydrolase